MFKENITHYKRNGSSFVRTELRLLGVLFFQRTEEF